MVVVAEEAIPVTTLVDMPPHLLVRRTMGLCLPRIVLPGNKEMEIEDLVHTLEDRLPTNSKDLLHTLVALLAATLRSKATALTAIMEAISPVRHPRPLITAVAIQMAVGEVEDPLTAAVEVAPTAAPQALRTVEEGREGPITTIMAAAAVEVTTTIPVVAAAVLAMALTPAEVAGATALLNEEEVVVASTNYLLILLYYGKGPSLFMIRHYSHARGASSPYSLSCSIMLMAQR